MTPPKIGSSLNSTETVKNVKQNHIDFGGLVTQLIALVLTHTLPSWIISHNYVEVFAP